MHDSSTMSEVGSLTLMESKYEYEWKIPNFRSYAKYECGKWLVSPRFCTYHSSKNSTNTVSLLWNLRLYPTKYEKTEHIALYVDNCNEFEVTSSYSLTIVAPGNSNYNISKTSSGKSIFQPNGFPGNSDNGMYATWGWGEFAEKELIFSEQSKFLVNDTLTISCKIFQTSTNSENQKIANSTLEVHNHFENLLETGKFSDVTFIIGKKSMPLHKAILTNESTVFRAMFDHEMKEQKDNVVNIVDVDFDVMKELLRHVYAKKVNGIDKIADGLLIAADKYCLTALKELCEQTLCKNLDIDNALQLLELAIKYNATKLKSKTLNYVVKNLKDVVEKEEFLALNLDCKNELLISIAKNQ